MSQSPETIGTLSHSTDAEGDPAGWITFKDAKRQIRALIRVAGLAVGGNTFRPRRENRGELVIRVEGGSVSARRKPGAAVVFNQLRSGVEQFSTDELTAILAQG
jgi:hypothetical protein